MIRNTLSAPARRSSVGVSQQTQNRIQDLQIDTDNAIKAQKLTVEDGRSLTDRLKETESEKATTHRQALIDKILGNGEYAA